MLTWTDPDARLHGTAQVRTRATGTGDWSRWQPLRAEESGADGAEAKAGKARGGTASLWAGDSDGVQVRVVDAGGQQAAHQPAGLQVQLLDPGTDPAPATRAGRSTQAGEPAAAADAPEPRPSTVAKPPVITQSQWGASTDYDGTPSYGTEIKAAVIHHTGVDSDNSVSCADSPARMRTIQQEHFARGYYDIGYNFVVDRCGQIFEGRSGGMDLPVVGAHDIGFNTNTLGISYIGNFESAQPTDAALRAIARVVAWKFGMYGIDPTDKVTLVSGSDKGVDGNLIPKGESVTLPRVFGHRDTNATACPGAHLYSALPTIRTLAAEPGVSAALPTADTDRDGLADLALGTPATTGGAGSVTVVPGGEDGPVTAARRTISQASTGVPGSDEAGDGFGAATAWGDVNGDGAADLAVGAPGEDDTHGNADLGTVTVMYGPDLTTGFQAIGTGAGGRAGSAVAVGDFDADGHADVFSAGTGAGGTWRVDTPTGTVAQGSLGAGDGSASHEDAVSADFNRDGYADVALTYVDVAGAGRVTWFKGGAGGLAKVAVLPVKGGRSVAAGDIDGNGYDDLVIGQPNVAESGAHTGGQVTMIRGSASGLTATGAITVDQDSTGVSGAGEAGDDMGASVAVGDYDLDGYADVAVGVPGEDISRDGVGYADAGGMLLLRGGSAGMTGTGSLAFNQDTSAMPGVAEAGDAFGSSVVLADLSGYGRNDLAVGASGEDSGDGTVLYLSSGSKGFDPASAYYCSRNTLGTPAGAGLGSVVAP
ncbi:N-acetylmuramoyl-L-alanine amidase [Streptomyces sp. NPDC059740]|uniref:N-acetylmuramoyl-L-alanine amidase n=1 Tax=Streptomyces sp. NPDC059740 TaxID=3346926 RepID=UPI003667D3D6